MPDETVRLTYTQLAKARSITLPAARRLALRHRWRKQLGNDGLTHVWVPVSALPRDGVSEGTPDTVPDLWPELGPDGGSDGTANGHIDEASIAAIATLTRGAVSDALSDLKSDVRSVVPVLQEAINSLCTDLEAHREQLAAERHRADRAEGRAQEAENRAQESANRIAEAEVRVRELQEQLTAEMIEHRQMVALLLKRRSWWPWRR